MKKLSRKLVSLLLVATMVMAMGLTSFAASGTYDVKLFSSSGTEITHTNPFTGADIAAKSLTLYAEPITVGDNTGYISSLTVDGVKASTTTTTKDGITYPGTFTYALAGVEVDDELDIVYTITFVTSGSVTEHPEVEGSIQIVAR